jgi:hypothetical protein
MLKQIFSKMKMKKLKWKTIQINYNIIIFNNLSRNRPIINPRKNSQGNKTKKKNFI